MGIMIMMMKCYFNCPNEQSDDRALHGDRIMHGLQVANVCV